VHMATPLTQSNSQRELCTLEQTCLPQVWSALVSMVERNLGITLRQNLQDIDRTPASALLTHRRYSCLSSARVIISTSLKRSV
jgi:hypothetical protein